MKTKIRLRLLPALGLLTSAVVIGCTAQTFSSENILLPSPNFAPSGHGLDVLIDPFNSATAPSVFLARKPTARDDATRIYRLTSTNASFSPFTIESVDTGFDSVWRLGYAPADGLYGMGEGTVKVAKNQSVGGVWKVRRSQQQGNANTWTDDDWFYYAGKSYAYPSRAMAFARDNAGRIFVSGFAYDGKSYHWVVRGKASGSWTTVDNLVNPLAGTYDYSSANVTMQPGLCSFPGNANNPTPAILSSSDLNGKWTVRRSQDGGTSWWEVDSWPGGTGQATPWDAACDNQGNIYVVGCHGLIPNNTGWVVRRSIDGGSTWQTMLDAAPATKGVAVRVMADANGKVTVSGTLFPDGTTGVWKVLRCTNPQDRANWVSAFEAGIFPFGQSTYSRGRGVAADAAGNLFIAGITSGWTDTSTSPATTYDLVASLVRLVPAP